MSILGKLNEVLNTVGDISESSGVNVRVSLSATDDKSVQAAMVTAKDFGATGIISLGDGDFSAVFPSHNDCQNYESTLKYVECETV